jgi:hypothetical protein
MHIDFKITTWERAKISSEDEKTVLKLIEDGKLKDEGDFANLNLDVQYEILNEFSEYMTISENDNQATIEVYDDLKLIYNNGN